MANDYDPEVLKNDTTTPDAHHRALQRLQADIDTPNGSGSSGDDHYDRFDRLNTPPIDIGDGFDWPGNSNE